MSRGEILATFIRLSASFLSLYPLSLSPFVTQLTATSVLSYDGLGLDHVVETSSFLVY